MLLHVMPYPAGGFLGRFDLFELEIVVFHLLRKQLIFAAHNTFSQCPIKEKVHKIVNQDDKHKRCQHGHSHRFVIILDGEKEVDQDNAAKRDAYDGKPVPRRQAIKASVPQYFKSDPAQNEQRRYGQKKT
jgi:hypothetical protein